MQHCNHQTSLNTPIILHKCIDLHALITDWRFELLERLHQPKQSMGSLEESFLVVIGGRVFNTHSHPVRYESQCVKYVLIKKVRPAQPAN